MNYPALVEKEKLPDMRGAERVTISYHGKSHYNSILHFKATLPLTRRRTPGALRRARLAGESCTALPRSPVSGGQRAAASTPRSSTGGSSSSSSRVSRPRGESKVDEPPRVTTPRANGNNGNGNGGPVVTDGNDVVKGGVGDDVVNAGNGADKVIGGAGNDKIDGGAGNDRLSGLSLIHI